MAVEHCRSESKESYCALDASGCGRVSRATIGQDKLVSLADILTRRTDAAVYLLMTSSAILATGHRVHTPSTTTRQLHKSSLLNFPPQPPGRD